MPVMGQTRMSVLLGDWRQTGMSVLLGDVAFYYFGPDVELSRGSEKALVESRPSWRGSVIGLGTGGNRHNPSGV
jgi:hypothetical protein